MCREGFWQADSHHAQDLCLHTCTKTSTGGNNNKRLKTCLNSTTVSAGFRLHVAGFPLLIIFFFSTNFYWFTFLFTHTRQRWTPFISTPVTAFAESMTNIVRKHNKYPLQNTQKIIIKRTQRMTRLKTTPDTPKFKLYNVTVGCGFDVQNKKKNVLQLH